MSIRALALIALMLLVVLTWTSWMFRFDMHVVTNQEGYAVAYRLDRWTGNLRLLENDQWYPVTEGNPDDLQESLRAPKNSSY